MSLRTPSFLWSDRKDIFIFAQNFSYREKLAPPFTAMLISPNHPHHKHKTVAPPVMLRFRRLFHCFICVVLSTPSTHAIIRSTWRYFPNLLQDIRGQGEPHGLRTIYFLIFSGVCPPIQFYLLPKWYFDN